MGRDLGRMGGMSIASTVLYTKHYEHTLRKEEANVKMNTKEMTCKAVHCNYVSKNGRRGISGVIKELLISQGPPFRFQSEVRPYLCSVRRRHEKCSRVGCCPVFFTAYLH
jgi:hypothetical protein